ncbi:MAG: hypothetical protein JSW04_05380 [Desulfobacterales bacterium]|nr:MAG: hypothetical protein JSV38_10580 [Desulfobacterales bacterium]UCD90859.1 MAG: hypothetical protein JSW04_05380 [Desulfobacterales bacterium]
MVIKSRIVIILIGMGDHGIRIVIMPTGMGDREIRIVTATGGCIKI